MTNSFRIIAIFLLLFVAAKIAAQALQVSGPATSNEKSLSLIDLPPFDPPGDSRSRFQAFWIPGDGNYIQFDPALDALSMTPQTYPYPLPATYTASAYLTGKYTNRKPPARAANNVTVLEPVSTPPPSGQFRTRLTSANPAIDIFSNHEIQKKYLTTFVISWPADLDASGIYLFYNGYKDSGNGNLLALPQVALKYSNTEVPAYFTPGLFDASKIREYNVSQMAAAGAVDGLTFPTFHTDIGNHFTHFLYFPSETATRRDMPDTYTENRLFPVLWADSTFTPIDTFMNFLVVLTRSSPISTNQSDPLYQQLRGQIARYHDNFSPETVFATSAGDAVLPQYIVAVADYQLEYLATFDPNQLTVDHIEKLADDDYRVTFRLEMCNKGKGIVEKENVSLTHSSDFSRFTPLDFRAHNSIVRGNSWQFEVHNTIPGVQTTTDGHEASVCTAVKFTARTNCRGIRGLWKGLLAPAVVRTCVMFSGTLSDHPECHGVTPIDSTRFHENGECFCCLGPMPPSSTEPPIGIYCMPWWLCLLFALIGAVIICWLYKRFKK